MAGEEIKGSIWSESSALLVYRWSMQHGAMVYSNSVRPLCRTPATIPITIIIAIIYDKNE